jgi:hypothetical protein
LSYDLFFRGRTHASAPPTEQILDYFAARPLYQLKGTQAWYSNEDTGVYFSFECQSNADENDEDERAEEPTAHELFYEKRPAAIEALIRAQQPPRQMPRGIAPDQVLDQELMDQARTGS